MILCDFHKICFSFFSVKLNELHFLQMPLPPRKKKKGKLNRRFKSHPYMIKLQLKIAKMHKLMNQIYNVANCDMIVLDAASGNLDFKLNLKFAKKLEELSKSVVGMSTRLTEVAQEITDKVKAALDCKDIKQGILFMEEVTDPKQKSDMTKKHPRMKFVPSCDFRLKTEHLDSSTEEEDIVEIFSGEPDGHFIHPKTKENPLEVHSFRCEICKAVFRDQNELHNHDSNHKMEFYHCLVCHKYLRSPRSFENH